MTKPIRIWGRTTSSNVKKVLWLADELKLAYERIGADMKFGEIDTRYRALNQRACRRSGCVLLWDELNHALSAWK
jgi:glutathione S-transferase